MRPVEIAGRRGARFDVDAQTTEGLIVKGIGQVVRGDDRLYVAVYVAPDEHYFEASRGSTERAMSTLSY